MKYKKQLSGHFLPEAENIASVCTILTHHIKKQHDSKKDWGVLCIGTDRITGDCLGPVVGTKLLSHSVDIPVFGTLAHPVHAANLPSMMTTLLNKYPNRHFLAVDAAVGPREHIGSVSVAASPVYPGGGMEKSLPPVGDISITGIIGEEGSITEWTLPYTRLYLVDTLAEFISQCILQCLTS